MQTGASLVSNYADLDDDGYVVCPVCRGRGTDRWEEEDCPECWGEGEVPR